MTGEAYNHVALSRAQLARLARHVVALRCRTDYYRPAGGRFGVRCLRARQDNDDRPGVVIGERISIGEVICGQIDGKSPSIRVPDPIDRLLIAMMRIGESAPASVSVNQLPN